METANKHVAAIFRNYNETMKSIRQHCGSHFSYLVTGLTDRVQAFVLPFMITDKGISLVNLLMLYL